MRAKFNLRSMIVAALLCAIGIIIPMFSPIKFAVEPVSFTLASHVAIFIAMFISPGAAAFVALGTTVGFFFGGFPLVIVARAATHIIFALIGAFTLKKWPEIMDSIWKLAIFAFIIAVVHGASEILAVTPFYMSNGMTVGYYSKGYVTTVVLLVGVGSIVHSMVDFCIALLVWKPIKKLGGSRPTPQKA